MSNVISNTRKLPQHVVRSIVSPLQVMAELGFDSQSCLQGTGIRLSQLSDPKAFMSLKQELTFYRNCLELTGDPTIGLALGRPFTAQRHGLIGYAVLSAATFRHALNILEHFGQLTFTFFTLRFGEDGRRAWFSFTDPPPIEQRLLHFYGDRDMAAAQAAFSEMLGQPLRPLEVCLAHDGHGQSQTYRDYFGTVVNFDSEFNQLIIDPALLDRELPRRIRILRSTCSNSASG